MNASCEFLTQVPEGVHVCDLLLSAKSKNIQKAQAREVTLKYLEKHGSYCTSIKNIKNFEYTFAGFAIFLLVFLYLLHSDCFTLSPRRPYEEYKRMVLEHTHGLFIT